MSMFSSTSPEHIFISTSIYYHHILSKSISFFKPTAFRTLLPILEPLGRFLSTNFLFIFQEPSSFSSQIYSYFVTSFHPLSHYFIHTHIRLELCAGKHLLPLFRVHPGQVLPCNRTDLRFQYNHQIQCQKIMMMMTMT